jgi:hypothetical protein
MPLVKIRKEEAATKLAAGPLGIGESHDNPAGRNFLRELIALKLVKVLFLEVPGNRAAYGEHKDPKRSNRGMYDECLARAVMSKQGNLAREEVLQHLEPMDGHLRAPHTAKTSALVCDAMMSGVRIVFCDKNMGYRGKGDHPDNMSARNTVVEAWFNANSFQSGNAQRSGCVILFGAEHFESKDAQLKTFIGQENPDRPGTGIPQTVHWVDLSN